MPGEDKEPEVSRKVALRAVDERVARLAIRQHGAFTRQQAKKEGSTDEVIACRLATGRSIDRRSPRVTDVPSSGSRRPCRPGHSSIALRFSMPWL